MKIAILIDRPRKSYLSGEEGEREDLQKQKVVKAIYEVLSEKFKCTVVVADKNFILKLQKENVDMVFNLCNGIRGETRLAQVPAILEFFGIPYTGSSILGHALSINKVISSRIFKSKGINTPGFLPVYRKSDLTQLKSKICFPAIVKPADEGSSRGVHQDSLVYDMKSLSEKLKEELEVYNPPIMINEYIPGREFTVGILGCRNDVKVLPILEISYDHLPDHLPKFSSFELKCHYNGYRSKDLCPAPLDDELESAIIKTAKAAYRALDIRDYGRVDIRLKDDVPYVLEINSLPGLERGYSDITKMADVAGLGYEGLVYSIVDSAIKCYHFYKPEDCVV